MKRYFVTISIVVVLALSAFWAWLRYEIEPAINSGHSIRNRPNLVYGGLDEVTGTLQQEKRVDYAHLNPKGRFEGFQVVDKVVVSAQSAEKRVVVYYLLLNESDPGRLVLLEEHYNRADNEGVPTLSAQYAAVGDEIIFDADPLKISISDFEDYLELVNGFISRKSRLSHFVQVKMRSPSIEGYLEMMNELRKRFPNTIVSRDDLHFTSNEPSEFSSALHWHLDQVKAPDAWGFSTGSDEVVVAVIDTGCFIGHPDLVDNIFVNKGEIPENGIDDDNNGFVDDVNGWDFLDDDTNPDDETGHGTHVSGITGARGNNGIGTSGASWNVKVLPLKVGDNTGLSSSSIAEALRYVSKLKQDGVNVVATNNSYGSNAPNNVARSEIQKHEDIGVLFVAAAGNNGEDIDAQGNSQYPAGFPESNIISVANSTQGDDLSFGSNYGLSSVDIAAPGQEVYSTYNDGGYEFLTGTSMSSPLVAGALALLAAHEPNLTSSELRQRLFDTAEPIASLSGKTVSGGRLDLLAMLDPELVGHFVETPSHPAQLVLLPDIGFQLVIEVSALNDAIVSVEYLGDLEGVSIQEESSRLFSVRFAENGEYRFRFKSVKHGIARELDKVVVVGSTGDVTSGLIHSWDMEGTGAELVDNLGSENGLLVGASRIDAPLGRGVDFDGTSSYARFTSRPSSRVTLSAFVKSDDLLSSPHPRIVNMPDYYLYFSTRGISNVPDGNANTLKFYSNRTDDFGVWNSPPDTVFEGEWMHVLASYDSNELTNTPKLYINGTEQKVRVQRLPAGQQTFDGGESFLGDRMDGDRAWDGQMDEVRVYNRVIDRDEVSRLAARYALAFWDAYSIKDVSEEGLAPTVTLGLFDDSGESPNASFEWSLENESESISLGANGNSVIDLIATQDVNARVVLKASSPLATRYFGFDLTLDPPVIEPGVYTGSTLSGGVVWVEVEKSHSTGYVTLLEGDGGFVRIREPVTINAFGEFQTKASLGQIISGKIDGGLSGSVDDFGIQFSGERIIPSSVATGFSGIYSGGLLQKSGELLELRVFDNGEIFVWNNGSKIDLAQGTMTGSGGFNLVTRKGSTLIGSFDEANRSIRGTLSTENGVESYYLRDVSLDVENRYVNLSTRGFSGVGENVLIGGFVLSGTEPRTVLIRGLGPELENRGVANFIEDPFIKVFSGNDVIAENQDWGDATNLAELVEFSNVAKASELTADSKDAAVLVDLDPGLYTVFLDSNGSDGEGLFEIFDDPNEPYRGLYNVSTRGFVGGEASPLIAGFVVTGTEPKRVLIRTAGPALREQGVLEPLMDPWVEVYSNEGPIASNNDWTDGSPPFSAGTSIQGRARSLKEAFEMSGASPFELGSKDSALLIWLEPGLYTAITRGVEDSQGIALIEVYEVE